MKKELWLIWKNPKTRQRFIIGTLTKHNNSYSFKYCKNIDQVIKLGFDFFPGFKEIDKVYNNRVLFDTILSRLPNKIRTDYGSILSSYGLNENSSDMEILEKTKGRLLTDTFEFVPVFNEEKIEFELAGTRYCEDLEKCKKMLKIGEKLILVLEDNKHDKNAIYVKFQEYKIGYVPRYYSEQLKKLLINDISYNAYIVNLNIESQIEDELITIKVELDMKK